jgi:crossover junction endodeoxyribonuclease RuvC
MIYIGVDPGAVSGALGAIDDRGGYIDSFDIDHQDKHILAMVLKSRILSIIDPKEGAEICMENVHSFPKQGISSTFTFGRAVGVISAVCQLSNKNFTLVTPQVWKKHFGLSSDKNEALDMARMFWPEARASLKLKKNTGKAEALLIAEYWRNKINGSTR